MGLIKQKRIGIFIGIFISIFTFVSLAHAASITDLENKRDTLSRQADRVQQQATQAKQKVASLSDVVDNLNTSISSTQNQINDLQGQINSTESSITSVTGQISDQQKELDVQVKKQQGAIRTIYETTQQDPIILLGSGSSISSAITQDTYLEALETSVQSSMDKIKSIQDSLNKQKTDLNAKKKSLADDKQKVINSQSSLSAQKSQQANLLNLTAAQADNYDSQLAKMQKDITNLSSTIVAQRRALTSSGSISVSNVAGSGGYPYLGRQDSSADPWGFWNRECVSYTAWYWNSQLGKPFRNTRPGSGSAYNWENLATDQGYTLHSSPQKGDIIVWPTASRWGHVAIVQNPDPGNGEITVSQYNFYGTGEYTVMTLDPGRLGSYKYIR